MPFYSRFCIGESSERGCTLCPKAPPLFFRYAPIAGSLQKNPASCFRGQGKGRGNSPHSASHSKRPALSTQQMPTEV